MTPLAFARAPVIMSGGVVVFDILSGVGSVLGGLGGLFGSDDAPPSPRDNLLSQAQGAREAADKYGFNPLTMLQYGNVGGSFGSGAGGAVPPLASIEAITGGLKDLGQAFTDKNEQKKAHENLRRDETVRALDKLRGLAPVSDAVFGNRARNATAVGAPTRTVSKPDRTSVMVGGASEPVHGLSDAEEFEKRYGDLASAGYGFMVLAADSIKNAGLMYQDRIGQPFNEYYVAPAARAASPLFKSASEWAKDQKSKNAPPRRESNRNNAHGIRLPVSR